jgi:hypothetical protein
METQLEILEAQALKLTTSERAHLAERLIWGGLTGEAWAEAMMPLEMWEPEI